MAERSPTQRDEKDAPGQRAFEMEFGRIAAGIMIADNDPGVREAAHAISKARQAAEMGDYISAIRLLGNVKVTVTEANAPTLGAGVRPEDVEQALGDLRRALKRHGGGPSLEPVRSLCRAARDEAAEGHWQAAWALIDEADARLAEALASKGSP